MKEQARFFDENGGVTFRPPTDDECLLAEILHPIWDEMKLQFVEQTGSYSQDKGIDVILMLSELLRES